MAVNENEFIEVTETNDVPKIDPWVITRIIVLVLAILNAVLCIFGKETIEIADNIIYEGVTAIWIIVAPLWAGWKDNDVTKKKRMEKAAISNPDPAVLAAVENIEPAPDVEIEVVEFDEALYQKNMEENGELFKDKITDGIGEDIGDVEPEPDEEEVMK